MTVGAGKYLPLDMRKNIYDYFSFTGNYRFLTNTDTYVSMAYEIAGGDCLIYYRGNDLRTSSPKLNEWSISYTSSNLAQIIDYTDLGGVSLSTITDVIDTKFGKPSLLQGHDYIYGREEDDYLLANRGRDTLIGGGGNDIIRAGNGADQITGGSGSDTMYGGFGSNDFWDLDDGYADTIYLKSDQFAYNYVYGKAGNSPNGEKEDWLFGIEARDRVIIQGVPTSALTVEKIGEFIEVAAYGVPEAVFSDHSLTLSQAAQMVSGELG